MPVPSLDFRFSNTADWRDEFAILVQAGLPLPWAGVPAWAPGAAYDLGLARVHEGDLYVTQPDLGAGPWTSAVSFEADTLPSGASRWLRIGEAASYDRVPLDLTGKRLAVALKACTAAGDITDPRPKLRVGTADGGFVLTNARLGGVAWNVPVNRHGIGTHDRRAIGTHLLARCVPPTPTLKLTPRSWLG